MSEIVKTYITEEGFTKEEIIEQFRKIGIDKMSDCFIALTLGIVGQFMLSSHSKMFIFEDMLSSLEKKYSESEVLIIKDAMNMLIAKYNNHNDFMG